MKRRLPAADEQASPAPLPQRPEVTLFNIPGRRRPGAAIIDVNSANRWRGTSNSPAEGVEPHRRPLDDSIAAQVSAVLEQSGLAEYDDERGHEVRNVDPDGLAVGTSDLVTEVVATGNTGASAIDAGARAEVHGVATASEASLEAEDSRACELLLNLDFVSASSAPDLTLAVVDDALFAERPLDAFPSESAARHAPVERREPDELTLASPAPSAPESRAVDNPPRPGATMPAVWNGTIADPWSRTNSPASEWRVAVAAAPVGPSRRSSLGAIVAASLVLAAGIAGALLVLPADRARPAVVATREPASQRPEGPPSSRPPLDMTDAPRAGSHDRAAEPELSAFVRSLAPDEPGNDRGRGIDTPATPANPPAAAQPTRPEPRAEPPPTLSPPATRPGAAAALGVPRNTPASTGGARPESPVAPSGASRNRSAAAAVVPPPVARPAVPNGAATAPPPTLVGPLAQIDSASAAPATSGEPTGRIVPPAPRVEASPTESAGAEAPRTETAARADTAAPESARPDSSRLDRAATAKEASSSDGIAEALKHLQVAYERRDATLAKAVWPTVNERALARAFEGLLSQSVVFDRCQMNVSGAAGEVECRGVTTYVPRVGSQYRRTESRQWKFRVQKGDDRWLITSAAAR